MACLTPEILRLFTFTLRYFAISSTWPEAGEPFVTKWKTEQFDQWYMYFETRATTHYDMQYTNRCVLKLLWGEGMTGAVHGNTEIPAAHDTIGRPSTAPTDITGTDGRTGNAQFTQGERRHQNTSVIVTWPDYIQQDGIKFEWVFLDAIRISVWNYQSQSGSDRLPFGDLTEIDAFWRLALSVNFA